MVDFPASDLLVYRNVKNMFLTKGWNLKTMDFLGLEPVMFFSRVNSNCLPETAETARLQNNTNIGANESSDISFPLYLVNGL